MRKLVLLVCITGVFSTADASAGVIPSLESKSGEIGFYPITNEISFYKNIDDGGDERGETVQIVLINSFKLGFAFNFELTADYNFGMAPGMDNDHYVELSLVKPISKVLSINVQRIISSFEDQSVNQFGLRLSF
jgi:hypothetical protein